MGRSPSRRVAAIALLASAALHLAGCALLIPPSWRGRAPVPLAGPIDPDLIDGSARHQDETLAALPDDQLAARVDADQARLVEIASRPASDAKAASQSDAAELRAIADRLPRLQRELERRRGSEPGPQVIQ